MGKIVAPFVRSPYNYDTNQVSDETGLDTGAEGGAKQSFKEECDINTIVKRFGIGYEMPENVRLPQYGDFSNITDFHQALNQVAQTNENFELLPAHIRAEFNNNPGEFVDFVLAKDETGENRKKLKNWGLLSKEALERDRIAQERLEQENEAKALARAQERAKTQQDKPKT